MEKFPKKAERKEAELTQEELEKLYKVSISPGSSWSEIKKGYNAQEYISFVVTKDFDIYMSMSGHASIYQATDSWDYKFRGFVGKDGVNFYDQAMRPSEKNSIANKLKEFLKVRGLETANWRPT